MGTTMKPRPAASPKSRSHGVRATVLLPFIIFVVFGFMASETLYILNSRAAIRHVVGRLVSETTVYVESRLSSFLEAPQRVGVTISKFAHLIENPATRISRLELIFRSQLMEMKDINIASIGFSDGEYAEAQRLEDGSIVVGRAGRQTGGALESWTCGEDGRPLALRSSRPGYDPRTRPWYQRSALSRKPAWSDIYPYYSNSDLAVAASVPILSDGNLEGVVSVTVTLRGISEFLSSIPQAQTGVLAVLDGNGYLVAISGPDPRFVRPDGSRVRANESPQRLVARTAELLTKDGAESLFQTRFKMDGKQYVATSVVVDDGGWGIGWKVISILPESEYTAKLTRSDLIGSFIFLFLLMIALVMGWIAVDRVTKPLVLLESAVGDLACERFSGDSVRIVRELARRGDEIGLLAASFENMRQRLSESFDEMHSDIEGKKVLLKEVHHRVKNNLQIISSILSIQAGELEDPTVRTAFAACQERIQAMAFVHERVYQSEMFSEVEMGDYLGKICDSLRWSRTGMGSAIDTEVVSKDVALPLAQAIPCGLIVNELVVNSLKYGFPGGKSGLIRVTLSRVHGLAELLVEDDGIGKNSSGGGEGGGIGQKLVDSLVSQLRGSLVSSPGSGGSGLRIEIRFPS